MRWWHPAATDGDGVTAPAQPPAQQLVLVARAAAVADPRTTVVERLGAVLAEAPPPRPEQVNGRAVGIGGEPRAADMQSAMSTEPASLDALVDRAWQKLMQKVTIEQERRGYTRWPWQR